MSPAAGDRRGGVVAVGLLAALFVTTAVIARQESPYPPGRQDGQRYEVEAMVLENRDHAAQLCAGGVLTSLPPRCGGVPVEPWSWNDVEGEESLGGTTWGSVRLVGTFDGRVFHPTARPERPHPDPKPDPPLQSPCPAPGGGWTVVDPTKVRDDDAYAVMRDADRQPDVAGAWFTWPNGQPTKPAAGTPSGHPAVLEVEPAPSYDQAVVNLAFTGDLGRHQRDARARWGGGLCVTALPRTRLALTAVAKDITTTDAAAAGIHLLSWAVDEVADVVEVDVLIADERTQGWFEQRYGPGLVRLVGRLRPVD